MRVVTPTTLAKRSGFHRVVAQVLSVVLSLQGVFVWGPMPAHAAIVDGANALDALGQTTPQTVCTTHDTSYTESSVNNVGPATDVGFRFPNPMVVDSVHHRLFTSDDNARVLVFNLDASNLLIDKVADYVLGAPDFYTNNSGALFSQSQVAIVTGLTYDATGDRLFVADSFAKRVLVFDVSSITNGENAVKVLGQSDFTSNVTGVTQSGMSSPWGLSYDPGTSWLYVSDEKRVLVFDVTSIADGENAIHVLGQANFTSQTSYTTQNGLTDVLGVTVDPTNDLLYVSDNSNYRVMVFNVASITDGENAVYVLGQPNFVSSTPNVTQSGMYGVTQTAIDVSGNRLFVPNQGAGRVLVFDVATITNGENAMYVLGQPNFTSSDVYPANDAITPTASNLSSLARAVAYDASTDLLYVADGYNQRVMVFDVASVSNGENAVDVIGQATPSTRCSTLDASFTTRYVNNGGPGPVGLFNANSMGMAVDSNNHRLFVADSGNNRVLVFDLDVSNMPIDKIADNVLGQPDLYSDAVSLTQSGMYKPYGVAYNASSDTLYVADSWNRRVLTFDVTSITDGENATRVIGQSDFISRVDSISQSGLSFPVSVVVDPVTHQLYVGDDGASRVMVYDVTSVTNGENAVHVLGQPDFTTLDFTTAQNTVSGVTGLAIDVAGNELFVADPYSNRVMVFDVTSITDGENAVHVLGQLNFTSSSSALTQTGMTNPYGVAYDDANDRLFVGDGDNSRVLAFDTSVIVDGEGAVNVLGQPDYETNTGTPSPQGSLISPYAIAYDSIGGVLYTSDNYNRVMIFDAAVAGGGSNDPTLNNAITASRLKAGASSTYNFGFTLQNTISGTLTITFPAGFTVTAAATSGACTGGTVGTFGFTSSTLTAVKTGCTAGALTLSGATVTNHSTPGAYTISWVNDDPGEGVIYIIDDDQVTVTGNVDPTLTFNAGMQDDATACSGSFSGNGGTLALGVLTTGAVTTSDASGIDHICTRLSTNASGGASITVKSLNGTDGLKSTSVPTDTIPSSTATLVAGTAGYGLCTGSAGGDSGNDAISGAASPTRSSPFNTTCTNAAHNVGGLTTSAQNLWTLTGPSQNAFVRTYVKAAISGTTAAHADYADTLTFIGTGTF